VPLGTWRLEGAAVRAGDEARFAQFVNERWAAMVRLAYTLLLDKGRAEDVVQESFAKLWSAWPRVEPGDPEAYLRRIVVNQAISTRRLRWWSERPTDDLPDLPDLAGHADMGHVDNRQALAGALAALSPQQRAVTVLRYGWDLSEQQVADLLNCSVGAIKTHASRGLARLRAVLGEEATSARKRAR
jgi:RNA polymerase sigma-70 factor (sigma-E family)